MFTILRNSAIVITENILFIGLHLDNYVIKRYYVYSVISVDFIQFIFLGKDMKMIIFYSVPILPIIVLVLAVLNAGASWIKDVIPCLAGLLVLKNIYIDLFYSIYKSGHPPIMAILQFLFGIARVGVFLPILNTFLTGSGGLLGLIDVILSLLLIVPIISLFWLLGEMSSLAYGIGPQDESVGMAIGGNILSILSILAVYYFFVLAAS